MRSWHCLTSPTVPFLAYLTENLLYDVEVFKIGVYVFNIGVLNFKVKDLLLGMEIVHKDLVFIFG